MPDEKGKMTVSEAGKKGGKKGGEATKRSHNHKFYQDIGHKGGQKVRRLIQKGEESEKE